MPELFDDVANAQSSPVSGDFIVALTADNFDEAVEAAYQPSIPEGKQLATVTDFKLEYSKSNKPMFVWQFTVAEGKAVGKTLRHWTLLNSPMLAPMLRNLGITPQETPHLFEGGGLKLNREAVVNRQLVLDIVWSKTLKEDSANKAADELTNEDYYVNPKIRRAYPASDANGAAGSNPLGL